MENKDQLQKVEPNTDLFRLQPKVTIKPKLYHNCPSCQTRMTLSKDSDVLYIDPEKDIRPAYYYKCPNCGMEWAYDSFFRLIKN